MATILLNPAKPAPVPVQIDPLERAPALLMRVASSVCDFCDLVGRELGGSVLTQRQWPVVTPMPLSRGRGNA
jgi:hypothetical protein